MNKILMIFSLYAFFNVVQAKIDYPLGFLGRDIIEQDFQNLCLLNFDRSFDNKEESEALLKGMGIKEFSCAGLRSFLEEKIQLIVRDVGSKNIALFDRENRVAMHQDDKGFFKKPLELFFDLYLRDTKSRETFASNFGAALYTNIYRPGLWNAVLYGPDLVVDTDLMRKNTDIYFEYTTMEGEEKSLLITHPTSNAVVLVKDNFFMSFFHPNQQNTYHISNSLVRISLLIHESLHNEEELNHMVIYAYQALFLRHILNICDSCSTEEKTAIINIIKSYVDLLRIHEPIAEKRDFR